MTAFDDFFEEQMADPEFASAYTKARHDIDVIDQCSLELAWLSADLAAVQDLLHELPAEDFVGRISLTARRDAVAAELREASARAGIGDVHFWVDVRLPGTLTFAEQTFEIPVAVDPGMPEGQFKLIPTAGLIDLHDGQFKVIPAPSLISSPSLDAPSDPSASSFYAGPPAFIRCFNCAGEGRCYCPFHSQDPSCPHCGGTGFRSVSL